MDREGISKRYLKDSLKAAWVQALTDLSKERGELSSESILSVLKGAYNNHKIDGSHKESCFEDFCNLNVLKRVGEDEWVFAHYTFQEYFLAMHVKDYPDKWLLDKWLLEGWILDGSRCLQFLGEMLEGNKWEILVPLLMKLEAFSFPAHIGHFGPKFQSLFVDDSLDQKFEYLKSCLAFMICDGNRVAAYGYELCLYLCTAEQERKIYVILEKKLVEEAKRALERIQNHTSRYEDEAVTFSVRGKSISRVLAYLERYWLPNMTQSSECVGGQPILHILELSRCIWCSEVILIADLGENYLEEFKRTEGRAWEFIYSQLAKHDLNTASKGFQRLEDLFGLKAVTYLDSIAASGCLEVVNYVKKAADMM